MVSNITYILYILYKHFEGLLSLVLLIFLKTSSTWTVYSKKKSGFSLEMKKKTFIREHSLYGIKIILKYGPRRAYR